MIADPDRLDLDTEVAQLCGSYTDRQRLIGRKKGRKQRTVVRIREVPSLLDQLRAVLAEPMCQVDDACRRVPASTAPGNPHALAAYLGIEHAAHVWVADTLRAQPRATVEGNIRYLLGAAYGQPVMTGRITAAVHRWWQWARVGTGWDAAPRTLPDPCPWCGSRTLHIKPGDIAESCTAWCTECATVWEGAEVRVLGRAVEQSRVERAAAVRARRDAERERRRADEQATVGVGT